MADNPKDNKAWKQGVVRVVRPCYYKAQSHYAIFIAVNNSRPKEQQVEFTVKGRFFTAPQKGNVYRVTGTMKRDATKDQDYFDVVNSEMELAEQGEDGMVKYLLKEGPSLGDVRAKQLVAAFGSKVIDVLANRPEEFQQKINEGMFPGITPERMEQLVSWARTEGQIAAIKQKLYSLQIGPATVNKIISFFGRRVIEILASDPFQLQKVDGIGWTTADKIAIANGCPKDNPLRIKNGILYIMSQHESEGHTCIKYERLLELSQNLLTVPAAAVLAEAAKLLEEEELCTSSVQPQKYSKKPEIFDIVE